MRSHHREGPAVSEYRLVVRVEIPTYRQVALKLEAPGCDGAEISRSRSAKTRIASVTLTRIAWAQRQINRQILPNVSVSDYSQGKGPKQQHGFTHYILLSSFHS